jgi:hypothetical protein
VQDYYVALRDQKEIEVEWVGRLKDGIKKFLRNVIYTVL